MATITRLTKVESLWSLWNLIRDHWDRILLPLIGGGGMTYLALLTDWINAWGPIAWGFVFIIGAYAVLGIMYVWDVMSTRRFINRQAEIFVSRDGVNPRLSRFERQNVALGDFFNPFYYPHKSKDFFDCDIVGPVQVYLDACSLDGVEFRNCQIVIIRENIRHWGMTIFHNTKFVRGTMSNVTLMMSRGMYESLPEDLKKHVQVMHEVVT